MRRHDTDPISLVLGLLLLVTALFFGLGGHGRAVSDHDWLLPVALVAVGAAGLLASLPRRHGRRRDRR